MSVQGPTHNLDKWLIGGACVALVTAIYLLLGPTESFTSRTAAPTGPIVGQIIEFENDTRLKAFESFSWNSIRKKGPVRSGEALFCGEKSAARVRLNNGSYVSVGENSMIYFRGQEHEQILDLDQGSFRLKVKGAIKIAVGNEITEITGHDSEVQIVKSPTKPASIRAIRGKLTVVGANKRKVEISDGEFADFKPDKPLPPAPPETPYYWKFEDLYDLAEHQILDRPYPRKAQTKASFNPLLDAVLTQSANRILKISDHASGFIEVRSTQPFQKVLVQESNRPDFNPHQSRLYLLQQSSQTVTFTHEGNFYYRVRVLNQDNEISEWSNVIQFQVEEPAPPSAPQLIYSSNTGIVGQILTASWKTPVNAKSFMEIRKPDGSIRKSPIVHGQVHWRPNQPGNYQLRAYAVNQYEKQSTYSKSFHVAVNPAPVLRLAKNKDKVESKQRMVQSESPAEASISAPLKPLEGPPPRNSTYRSNQLSLNGFGWTIYSPQDPNGANAELPYTAGLGARILSWFQRMGLEASAKFGILGLNERGKETALKQMEARYHYRFFTPFPFHLTRELQISVFAGAEMYRNSAANLATNYNLFKFGTTLDFPWRQQWRAGGEFTGGMGSEGSRKYEISGFLGYFYDASWSLGVGYRIHLFEAGSSSTAPNGTLPYREGYTEGFSTLNYHF